MRVLGLDTATRTLSVGIRVNGRVAASGVAETPRGHGPTVLPLIERLLAEAGLRLAEIDLFAVSIGPGSFAGLRVGVSTIKGLAWTLGKPMVAVPTLEALAHATGGEEGHVCPMLDARRGEVYAAVYERSGTTLSLVRGPIVSTVDALPPGFWPEARCVMVGDGAVAHQKRLEPWLSGRARLDSETIPSGSTVAELGWAHWRARGADDPCTLEPAYLRASDAEAKRNVLSEGRPPELTAPRSQA